MKTLSTEHRRQLERTVVEARNIAEAGAQGALEALAVHHHEPYGHMSGEQRKLRNRLRAHARHLGDRVDVRSGAHAIDHLVHECAYEHWHGMLFARFLAENHLLIEPEMGVAITLDECEELAKEEGVDKWALAARFAHRMLPQVFRPDHPVFEVQLAREYRLKLEDLVELVPSEVFIAADALGWVYQFWQTKKKDEVNRSEDKVGADELASVTQLFTEDYMVEFLLHNTIGAWWSAKQGPIEGASEAEARSKLDLPGREGLAVSWSYLRLVKDSESQKWAPAAGGFEGWPSTAAELTCFDPCMGSAHFLAFVIPILARLRMAEDPELTLGDAVKAVLRNNIFGLELDQRCTQIGAFNIALTAWKLIGYQLLPTMNIACSGIAPETKLDEWLTLAGEDDQLVRGMEKLHGIFRQAPTLGSLIDPTSGGDLVEASFDRLAPLVEQALARESAVDRERELAVAAAGIAKAAKLLSAEFTLIATNVPYLGRGKQDAVLRDFSARTYPGAKADLATCFIERCSKFCEPGGTYALVSPQNWWFSPGYTDFRKNLLSRDSLRFLVTLGEEAWQSFGDRGPVASMLIASRNEPEHNNEILGVDALPKRDIDSKISELRNGTVIHVQQIALVDNPDSRLTFQPVDSQNLLDKFCESWQGLVTSDNPRFMLNFWEAWGNGWEPFISSPTRTRIYGGRENVIAWMDGKGALHNDGKAHNFPPRSALGRRGVLLSQVRSLASTIYTGEIFAHGSAPVIPADDEILPALWCYLSSDEYPRAVRNIDKKLAVTNSTLIKVEFDEEKWREAAEKNYPDGLPSPYSSDPTQWIFDGHPDGADQPLQVAVARLLGYRWPRQVGANFYDCPTVLEDSLEEFEDRDGVVCLVRLNREEPAAIRLRGLLSRALHSFDERDLLRDIGARSEDLETWLLDEFFEQHFKLFSHRPFIWHIWDGRKRDGFHALVNYHKLTEGDGKGRRLLESLTYSYLGDWITRQHDGVKRGESGAEDRLAAALELQKRLIAILEGEPPFDLFVRWKPIAEQPIGWEPDINDGVRLNIRPFMAQDLPGGKKGAGILRNKPNIHWRKDRGKEPTRDQAQFPWFWKNGKFTGERVNDVHLTNAEKRAAREAASTAAKGK